MLVCCMLEVGGICRLELQHVFVWSTLPSYGSFSAVFVTLLSTICDVHYRRCQYLVLALELIRIIGIGSVSQLWHDHENE